MENKKIQATPKEIAFVLLGVIGFVVLIVDWSLFLTIALSIGAVWLIWKKLPLKRDHKWSSTIGVIVLSLITAFIILSTEDRGLNTTIWDSTPTTTEKSDVQKSESQSQKEEPIPEQKEAEKVQPKTSAKSEISSTPKPNLVGRWYGKTDVYLVKEGGKYVATFDPPVSTNIYPYFIGLLEEAWGLLPSQMSNPQVVSPAVFYENYSSGEKFIFLPFRDEASGAIFGVSFWRE